MDQKSSDNAWAPSAMDIYNQQMEQNYKWQQFYQQPLSTAGLTSPEGHTLLPYPKPPFELTSSEVQQYGSAPDTTNPSGMLYRSGNENAMLLSSAAPQCGPPKGSCLPSVNKPDPRSFQVKPLYTPHVFQPSSGTKLPTAYNVTGMY